MRSATYLPILKAKQGEFTALRELGPTEAIAPLIEIPKIPWNFKDDQPACSVDDHIAKMARAIRRDRQSCANLLLDAGLLEDEGPSACSRALREVLSELSADGTPAIPVTGLERAAKYQQVVRGAHRRDGGGCCIRLEREDLFDLVVLKSGIAELLKATRVAPEEADLIVDLKSVSEDTEAADLEWMLEVLPELPLLSNWRSLWLAGSAFPEFLTEVRANTLAYLPRVEWTIWSSLLKKGLASARVPRFADYGIAHPANLEVDFRKMRMSANLRYTVEDHWLVLRGRNVRDYGYGQFNDLCKKVVDMPEYYGAEFSWGDGYIMGCAEGEAGPGSASTWRKVGNSHHFQVALAQIEEIKSLL